MRFLKQNAFILYALIPFVILLYAHVGMLLIMYPLYLISNFILMLSLKVWFKMGYIAFFHKSKNGVFLLTSIVFLAGYVNENIKLYL